MTYFSANLVASPDKPGDLCWIPDLVGEGACSIWSLFIQLPLGAERREALIDPMPFGWYYLYNTRAKGEKDEKPF